MALHEKKKFTLRLNKRLIEQAKQYAARHDISVSELVETFLLNLVQGEESEHTPLVNQLTGVLPDFDMDQEYRRYLEEKYDG
jgi:hypothetical protein